MTDGFANTQKAVFILGPNTCRRTRPRKAALQPQSGKGMLALARF